VAPLLNDEQLEIDKREVCPLQEDRRLARKEEAERTRKEGCVMMMILMMEADDDADEEAKKKGCLAALSA